MTPPEKYEQTVWMAKEPWQQGAPVWSGAGRPGSTPNGEESTVAGPQAPGPRAPF